MLGFYNVVQTGNINFICFTVEKSGTVLRKTTNRLYEPRRARKSFFGSHDPDSPARVHLVTETNASLLISD